MIGNQQGTPGAGNPVWSTPRQALYQRVDGLSEFPLPIVIDGTKVYNTLNGPFPWLLYAGTLIGKVTATGLYAPSIIGAVTTAYTSGGTTLAVAPAVATAIANRIGQSGTFKTQGPPSVAGTDTTITTTFSAVNQTTGALTVTSLGANVVSGSLIKPTDGSETPLMVVCDITGVKTTDYTNINTINNYVVRAAVGGILNTNMIPFYPGADASTRAAIAALTQLRGFYFSDQYGF
jgi:hypothetical protein